MAHKNVIRPVFGKAPVEEQGIPDDLADIPTALLSMCGKDRETAFKPYRSRVSDLDESGMPQVERVFVTLMGSVEIQKILHRLVARNERKIEANRAIAQSYSTEDLQARLKRATDANLQRRPWFYYALVDEMRRRRLFF